MASFQRSPSIPAARRHRSTGNATWFSGLGSPYGGCGLPQSALDSQNFLALNVQNSPGNYSNLPRPISAADAAEIGMWDNGLNCGRWVKVTIGPNCNGTNDGAPNEPFCRGGAGHVGDQYDGATLDMVVGDSCDDGNAWCKDDPYHVDLAQASLNKFVLNGQPVGNMYPGSWNNRQVTWQFESAPNYTGDINIGAIQGAQPYWPAIAISHLPNGIHAVQYFANGAWASATMDSDQGDDYIISPTTGAGTGARSTRSGSSTRPATWSTTARYTTSACLPAPAERLQRGVHRGELHVHLAVAILVADADALNIRVLVAHPVADAHAHADALNIRVLARRVRLVRADLDGHQLLARRLPAAVHRWQQGHHAADRVDGGVRVW